MSRENDTGAHCADRRADGGVMLGRRALILAAAGAGAMADASVGVSARAAVGQGRHGPMIDAHVHLQSDEWFKANVFERRTKSNRRRRSERPPLEAVSQYTYGPSRGRPRKEYDRSLDGQAQKILDEMDEAGIDVAFLYAMDYDYTNEKLALDHWGQLAELARVRDAHPGRFLLLAAIDPRRGAAGLTLFRRAVEELGVVGMGEFAPHFFGFAPNDRERCYPLYELCSDLAVPIAPNCSIIASSHNSEWCHPLYFEQVAHDFPDLNICLTSAGLPHWTDEAFALAMVKHNIFIDTADWQSPAWSDPVGHALAHVRRAMDTGCRRKILFGSDYPVYTRGYTEKDWADVFLVEAGKRGQPFSEEELHLFFSENAQDFVDLDIAMPKGR